MTAQTLPQLHTLAEVAKRYRLSLRSLRKGATANPPEFTHIHLGRERYLTNEMVTELLAKSTVTAQTAETQRDADLAKTRERVGRKSGQRRPAA